MVQIGFENNFISNHMVSPNFSVENLRNPAPTINQTSVFKHCKTDHLPKTGRLFRIGTLSQFRVIEDDAVRDEMEGKFNVEIVFKHPVCAEAAYLSDLTCGSTSITLSKDIAYANNNIGSSVFLGRRTVGEVLSFNERIHVKPMGTSKIKVQGQVSLSFEAADAYVFCLTESPEEGSLIYGSSYDARYGIPVTNLINFLNLMSEAVFQELTKGDWMSKEEFVGTASLPAFSAPASRMNSLSICVIPTVHRVTYIEKAYMVDDANPLHVQNVSKLFDHADITKPARFSIEQEVRLIFRPVLTDGEDIYMIPYKLKPIFVPCEPCLKLLEV